MKIEAIISVPQDANVSPSISLETEEIYLKFIVIDPCATTVLDPFTVADMETTVLGTADLQDLTSLVPADTVST